MKDAEAAAVTIQDMPVEWLRRYASALEAISEAGRIFASEQEFDKLAPVVTEACMRICEAQVGGMVSRVGPHGQEACVLVAEPGATPRIFEGVKLPPASALISAEITRIADATRDDRFRPSAPRHGLPAAIPPLVSALTIPIRSPSGEGQGGLFFGHPAPGRFTAEHERLLAAIARHAGGALENATFVNEYRVSALANARLAAIVQSSDDAIVSKDLNGVIESWNKGAERMFEYSAEEIIGKPVTLLIPADRPHEEDEILERLRKGEPIDHFETIRRTKSGRQIHVSVTISPIRDAEGRIVGASKVARDITEQKLIEAAREQLLGAERAARAEAERHSRMKDEFLATLGHELRTPLNAVMGWAQLLLRRKPADPEIGHGLEVIERNSRQQAQLIEDLLDMGRIVSGQLRLDVQAVDLRTVIESALEAIRPAADAKGIRLHKVIDSNAGVVSGDPGRLHQIVWNLVSNAVKFTSKNGRVEVLLTRVNSHLEMAVADTGEGIAPDFLPYVFDRFRQGDSSLTRGKSGLGLGLAIVKHLVELHGGTVSAQSEGLGKGATFRVDLPIRVAHPSSVPPPYAQSAPSEISLRGLTVLVVDDELDARELVRRMLEDAGAQVQTAASAQEAIMAIQQAPPDLLLSDIGMPYEDGYSLIRRLRKLPADKGGNTAAVALTAFARTDDRRNSLLAGFQMHVPKPVDARELVTVVASVTRRV